MLPVNIQRRESDKVAAFFDCGHGQNEGTEGEDRGAALLQWGCLLQWGVRVFEKGRAAVTGRGPNADRR